MPGLEDTALVHKRSLHPEISPSYEGQACKYAIRVYYEKFADRVM